MVDFSGELFDGRSTTPIAVVLSLTPEGLAVRHPDGTSTIVQYSEIRSLEKAGDSFRCSIAAPSTAGDTPAAVLLFSQEALYRELAIRISGFRSPLHRVFTKIGSFKIWQVFLIVIAALVLFIALLYALVL